MSETSFPFIDGGGGDSGPYSAEFFAGILDGLFKQEDITNDNRSVIYGTGNGTNDSLEVTQTSPASNSIEVKQGKALIKGYYYVNDSDLTLEVSANVDGSGFDRIDTVVVEIDFINAVVRSKIIEGTASGSPVAPTLTKNSSVYQVPIANIDVANLFTTILDADIDNTVKEQATIWSTFKGGTGISGGYVNRDLIVGTGVETLGTINLPEGHIAVGGSSNVDSIDHRVIEAYGSVYTASNSHTWTKVNFTTLVDPTGYASLVGGSLRLQAGTYLFISAYQVGAKVAGSFIGHGLRLRNATSGTVIDQREVQGTSTPAVDSIVHLSIGGKTFDSNGSQDFNMEYSTNGTWAYTTNMTNFQRFYFRRIK